MGFIKRIKNLLVLLLGFNSYLYGNINIVRMYTRFPRFLPINVRIQHGWYHELTSYNEDLVTERPIMLVWSKRMAEIWKARSEKPVVILGSPFVLYRRMKNILLRKDAKGTVVFPHHSTKSTQAEYELEEYCKALHSLPEDFKPVTVCLYYMDMPLQGPIFERNGFRVVTAGRPQWTGFRFVNRFYDILSKHQYSTSNLIGSYTFYAVEMGIPFFLSGKETTIKLRPGQKKLTSDTVFKNSDFMENLMRIFYGITRSISEEQRKVVLDEVGINDNLSPRELRRLFIKNLTPARIIGKVHKLKS